MMITEQFARFIKNTNYEDIPREIIEISKERILDTVGSSLAGCAGWGYRSEFLKACSNLGSGNCNVIGGSDFKFPPARAAMINATFAHTVELDDGHKYAGIHAGAVVVTSALTLGAQLGCSGKDILAAVVLGYELVYRVGVAQAPHLINHGFHPSGVCDTIGAMAVAGKLLNLSEEQLANGLGLAGLYASGLMEATVSGQQSKCVMVGNAAMNGIMAAYMAQEGLEGTLSVFEGKNGMFNAMSENVKVDEVWKDLGTYYSIGDTYSKFYPTCRHSQFGIESVIDLMTENGFKYQDVAKIEVGTYEVAHTLTGTIYEPKNSGEAKFSMPYCIALALDLGGVAASYLSEAYYTKPLYLELAKLVEVKIDHEVQALYPKKRGAIVKIILKDGTSYTNECFDLKGSPTKPVGKDVIIKKFRDNGSDMLDSKAIEQLLDSINTLEAQTSVTDIYNMLCSKC